MDEWMDGAMQTYFISFSFLYRRLGNFHVKNKLINFHGLFNPQIFSA